VGAVVASPARARPLDERDDHDAVTVEIEVRGSLPLTGPVTELGELDGVIAVHAADANADPD